VENPSAQVARMYGSLGNSILPLRVLERVTSRGGYGLIAGVMQQ